MTTIHIRNINRNVMRGRTTISLIDENGKAVGFLSLSLDLPDPNVKTVTIQ